MRPSPGNLNRATLERQLLTRRASVDVITAIRRLVAVQAQQPAAPYVALWNRISDFDFAGLDAALADHTVVKSTLLRITLHLTHHADHAPFRAAMEPTIRGARLDDRFAASGLTPADADAFVPALLDFTAEPRTTAQIDEWLAERFDVAPHPGLRRAWRGYTPLWHFPRDEPWSFGTKASFVAAGIRPELDAAAARRALPELIRRYLEGYGPASVADIAQFTSVRRAGVRAALEDSADELRRLTGPDGVELYDVADGVIPDADTPTPPRLLPMWDNVLLAYSDRSRVIPPDYRSTVIRRNGDVLPTLLVDGRVAGVWRATDDGIEANAFHRLDETVWRSLESEAASLTALLRHRDGRPFRRYDHWWSKLPVGEVRTL